MIQKIGSVTALDSTLESFASSQLVMRIHVEMVLLVFQNPVKMLFASVLMEGLESSAMMVRKILLWVGHNHHHSFKVGTRNS